MSTAVRKYSLKVSEECPEDPLAHAMGTVATAEDDARKRKLVELQEWHAWLRSKEKDSSDDPELKHLERQKQDVIDTWKKFASNFPDLKQDKEVTGIKVPSVAELQAAVSHANDSYETKRKDGLGLGKKRFLGFLNIMHDYSWLFSIVPSNDMYTSLITGVVSTIVKASSNHSTIAESFAKALATIVRHLEPIAELSRMPRTSRERRFTIELYTQIFEFLCYMMTWLSSWKKRLFASLNKQFYDENVLARLNIIEATVASIYREADSNANSCVFEIYELVKLRNTAQASRDTGNDQDEIRSILADLADQVRSIHIQLGRKGGQYLGAVEQQFNHDRLTTDEWRKGRMPEVILNTEPDELDFGGSTADDHEDLISTKQIIGHLRILAPYIQDSWNGFSGSGSGMNGPILPQEVMADLRACISSPQSNITWVEGAADAEWGSPLSMTARHICTLAANAGIPCVSYFCKPRYDFARQHKLLQAEAATVALMYSLVTQFVYLLPETIESAEGLDEDSFKLLNGTLENSSFALDILRRLLPMAPPTLLVVLDGLQTAEMKSTIPYHRELLEILRDAQDRMILKVLFTTDGNSRVLMRQTKVTERINAARIGGGGARTRAAGRAYVSEWTNL